MHGSSPRFIVLLSGVIDVRPRQSMLRRPWPSTQERRLPPTVVRILAISVFCCAVSACAGSTGASRELTLAKEGAFLEHVLKAERLEREGRLADALDHWRIALALEPESVSARQRESALQNLIIARVATLTSEADAAEAARNDQSAVHLLLQALELEPDNQILMQRVISLQRKAARNRVARDPRRADLSPTGDRVAYDSVTTAAREAEEKYQAGVAAFKEDKAKARHLFREAVRLDPTHLGARAYLRTFENSSAESDAPN
jgi:tetratricopeptide (TPR) repeat protein